MRATSRRRPLVFTATAQLDQFADTTAAPEVTKNATLRAERANYLDAGVTQQIIPGLKVGSTSTTSRRRTSSTTASSAPPSF